MADKPWLTPVPPERYLLIPVVDGRTCDEQATTVEISEPDAGEPEDDPELAAVMEDCAELAAMGFLEFEGPPDDPDTHVTFTDAGWAYLEEMDRKEIVLHT